MSEEITERYHVRRREFLNEDPYFHAHIIGIVEDTRAISDDDPERSWTKALIVLDLSDCSRTVSFSFYMDSPAERANTLRKISLIAEVVNAVRDGIVLEVESIDARLKRLEVKAEEKSAADEHPQIAEDVMTQPRTSSQITTLGL